MSVLKADFVERRITSLSHVPADWYVGAGHHYQLNLRMCQIQSLQYGFTWGQQSSRQSSVLQEPRRILQLDISLNELATLEYGHLSAFTHLRALHAGLNRITRFNGVSTLKYLRHLDLSHNRVSALHGLEGCEALTYLNLSMNLVDSLTDLPALGQLREVYLNSNKLKSLDGIQSLPQLKVLHCARNIITDIVPLSSSFRLTVLNAADNSISSLSVTTDVVRGLPRLQAVTLQGNPLDKHATYQTHFVKSTGVIQFDNVNVRPLPKDNAPSLGSTTGIKEATQAAFLDHISERKEAMEENICFLQERILAQQQEFRDYEEKAKNELDACLRYLDTLSVADAQKYSQFWLSDKNASKRPEPKDVEEAPVPFSRERPLNHRLPVTEDVPVDKQHIKGDYRGIKLTDEVLRHAYNELAKQQGFPE